jgi:hypothetical protein
MRGKKENFEHAKHNEKVCRHLIKQGEFNDWVATTAYYAAIYFVCAELFPDKFEFYGKQKYCLDFGDYYQKLGAARISKHSEREDLVRDRLPEIYVDFSTLREICTTARYNRYKITSEELGLVVESLDSIVQFCQPFEGKGEK